MPICNLCIKCSQVLKNKVLKQSMIVYELVIAVQNVEHKENDEFECMMKTSTTFFDVITFTTKVRISMKSFIIKLTWDFESYCRQKKCIKRICTLQGLWTLPSKCSRQRTRVVTSSQIDRFLTTIGIHTGNFWILILFYLWISVIL